MTTTQTSDLASWLTAVWDEEERAMLAGRDEREVRFLTNDNDGPRPDDEYLAVHIGAGWVLARIAADRKILELHTGPHSCPELKTGIHPDDYPEGSPWGKAGESWRHASNEYFEDEPCPTQRLLASAYKDREGFQEAWL